jgi:hypothetical protein
MRCEPTAGKRYRSRGVDQRDVDPLAEPVLSRCHSAARIPTVAHIPAAMSAPETPNRAGGPSGCPVMLMMPESACAMAS